MFYSSKEKKMVTLAEYVARMPEEQKYIYYAVGASVERLEKLPQTELVADKGYEILYFTDDVDEFAIKMLGSFQGKEFKSVSGSDLGLEKDEKEAADKQAKQEDYKEIFEQMTKLLEGKVTSVQASERLKSHPVCLSSGGELTIEMEKVLNAMPYNNQKVKADKILEINVQHEVFQALQEAFKNDQEKFKLYTDLLYNQALLIEGLPIEDPVQLTNNICKMMK